MVTSTSPTLIELSGYVYNATSERETFNPGAYSTESYMYPDDLLSNKNQYGGNYVVFFVKVHEDSYLVKDKGTEVAVDGAIAPRSRGVVSGLPASGIKRTGQLAGAAAGMAAGPTSKAVSKVAPLAGANPKLRAAAAVAGILAKGVDAGIGAYAATWAIDKLGGAVKEYKQMRAAIALYIPSDISTRYSASWADTSLAGTSALAHGLSSENITAVLSGKLTGMAQGPAGYLVGMALKTPGAGEIVSKTTGVTANPKKEQLFQNVDFRTFTFTYQFFPRSEKEAQNVQRIIKMFKMHMHPEFKKDTAEFLYIYPSEFDILYFNNGTENINLHKHTSCVLSDMSITYGGQNQFTTFEGGVPVQVNINLTFKELALMSKESIEKGY